MDMAGTCSCLTFSDSCFLISTYNVYVYISRTFTERVEMLRKVKEERVAKSKAENAAAFPAVMGIAADDDSDDSDDSDDDDATYFDWRAKEI